MTKNWSKSLWVSWTRSLQVRLQTPKLPDKMPSLPKRSKQKPRNRGISRSFRRRLPNQMLKKWNSQSAWCNKSTIRRTSTIAGSLKMSLSMTRKSSPNLYLPTSKSSEASLVEPKSPGSAAVNKMRVARNLPFALLENSRASLISSISRRRKSMKEIRINSSMSYSSF